jgi:hypothetical protein
MALAILLSFALGPLMLLRRWRLGRVPAVIVAVLLAFSMIGGIGTFLGTQLAHLAADLPGYQTNISQKIHALRDSTGSGEVVDRTSKMVTSLDTEIEKPTETGDKTAVDQPAAPLLQPLATAGIRRGFCHLLSAPAGRFAGPVHPACRCGRSSAHDGGAGRRSRTP